MTADLKPDFSSVLTPWIVLPPGEQTLSLRVPGCCSVCNSVSAVPFIIWDKDERHEMDTEKPFGLANVAPTVAELLGVKPYDCWEESMIKH